MTCPRHPSLSSRTHSSSSMAHSHAPPYTQTLEYTVYIQRQSRPTRSTSFLSANVTRMLCELKGLLGLAFIIILIDTIHLTNNLQPCLISCNLNSLPLLSYQLEMFRLLAFCQLVLYSSQPPSCARKRSCLGLATTLGQSTLLCCRLQLSRLMRNRSASKTLMVRSSAK